MLRLLPSHYTELVADSGIDPAIVTLNFQSLSAETAYNYLFVSPDIPRSQSGVASVGWQRRYAHVWQGGWWCGGLDPQQDWLEMEWGCFKPDAPIVNSDGKAIKYEHPPLMPTRAFFLRVPGQNWVKTARLFDLELPSNVNTGIYWDWVKTSNIPIVLCEGAKKAAALLSYGYPAIAVPGINSGYRTDKDSWGNVISRQLIADLETFATPGREVYICFDWETKVETIKAVDRAIEHLGQLWQERGCTLKIIRLPGPEKGVDEAIVAKGINIFKEAFSEASDLETDIAMRREHHQLTYPIALDFNRQYVGELPWPESGIVGLKSPKGTGKTTALRRLVDRARDRSQPILLLTHRSQLGKFLCQQLGMPWIDNNNYLNKPESLALCVDSLLKIEPIDWSRGLLILDEVEQFIWHLLHSSTCQEKRLLLLQHFHRLIAEIVASKGTIVAADADLSDVSLDYLSSLSNTVPWIARNHWHPPQGWQVSLFDTPNPLLLIDQLCNDLSQGYKCYVATDSRTGKYGSETIAKYIRARLIELTSRYPRTLVIGSDTTHTIGHPAVQFVGDLNRHTTAYDAVFATPSLATGISIDVEHFDRVYGIFQGVIPETEVRQALARVRSDVPRYIWCAKRGCNSIGNGSNNYRTLASWYQQNYRDNYALLMPIIAIDIDAPIVCDPIHLRTWSKLAARVNTSLNHYRISVKAGLLREGHKVRLIEEPAARSNLINLRQQLIETSAVDKTAAIGILRQIYICQKESNNTERNTSRALCELKAIQASERFREAYAIANARIITELEYHELSRQERLTESDRLATIAFQIHQKYGIKLTPQLILKDARGYHKKIELHWQLIQSRENATIAKILDRIIPQEIEEQFLPDIDSSNLKIYGLRALGIDRLLEIERQFTADDPALVVLQQQAYECSQHVRRIFGIRLPPVKAGVGTIVTANKFLRLLALPLKRHPVQTKGRPVTYGFDPSDWYDERQQIFKNNVARLPKSTPSCKNDRQLLSFRSHDPADKKPIHLAK